MVEEAVVIEVGMAPRVWENQERTRRKRRNMAFSDEVLPIMMLMKFDKGSGHVHNLYIALSIVDFAKYGFAISDS